jgi:DNA helicase-2/ATP-dependent DNA helicase PcrA
MYLVLEKDVSQINPWCLLKQGSKRDEGRIHIPFISWTGKLRCCYLTFHSLCARILRTDGHFIGISKNFVIYDDNDQIDVIKEAMGRLMISIKDFKPNSVLSTISQAKNELIYEDEYSTFARGVFQQTVAKIYPLYQRILKENDALDFDDLILKTVRLFRETPQVLEKYQNQFEYCLVDEYQDTNRGQYVLTKLLTGKWKNICVVGDFSQSIYSWRRGHFSIS